MVDPIQFSDALERTTAFLEADDLEGAVEYLRTLHPADSAEILAGLESEQQAAIIDKLRATELADVFEQLDEDEIADVAQHLDVEMLDPRPDRVDRQPVDRGDRHAVVPFVDPQEADLEFQAADRLVDPVCQRLHVAILTAGRCPFTGRSLRLAPCPGLPGAGYAM